MRFENSVLMSPAGKGSGDGSEDTESPNDSVYFESVIDLKKNLIPWMRSSRIHRLTIYAYRGETDEEVGHFVLTHERGRTTMVDPDGTHVALFGAAKRAPGASLSRTRAVGQTKRIEQWLQEKNLNLRDCTFDVFPYEEGDAEATEQEVARDEAAPQATNVDVQAEEVVAPEQEIPVAGPVEIASESQASEPPAEAVVVPEETEPQAQEPVVTPPPAIERKKIKGPRKPQRKKPTKAQRKERLTRGAQEDYDGHLAEVLRKVALIRTTSRQETVDGATKVLSDLSSFLQARPEFKPRFKRLILEDPQYENVRVFMSMFRDDRQWDNLRPPSGQRGITQPGGYDFAEEYRQITYLRRLAKDIYSGAEHVDPHRSHDAMHYSYKSERPIGEYAGMLFPDMHPLQFYAYIHSRGKERWLDIGSGETYRVPMSLMNVLPSINPNVTLIGVDPLYDEKMAATMDKAAGRHKLEPEWADDKLARGQLIPAVAQMLPVETESIDQILSVWAFDKFNEKVGGTPQALRQAARVLKPGHTARIYGIYTKFLAPDSVVHRYFDITYQKDYTTEETKTDEPASFVILRRKPLKPSQMQELIADIDAWIRANALPNA